MWDSVQFFLFVAVFIIPLIVAIAYVHSFEKSGKIAKGSLRLIAFGSVCYGLLSFAGHSIPDDLGATVFYFLKDLVPISVAILVIFRSKSHWEINEAKFLEKDELIADATQELLSSDVFLTTLRATLPKGAGDEKYGLDFIPFMLHSSDERRQNFEKSSQRFLRWTIGLGVLFSVLVVLFGYILINQSSAGTPQRILEIRRMTENLERDVAKLDQHLDENKSFIDGPNSLLQSLRSESPEDVDSELVSKVRFAIEASNSISDLQMLVSTLNEVVKGLPDDSENTMYKNQIRLAIKEVSEFLELQPRFFRSVDNASAKLITFIEETESDLDQPGVQTAETIKRLALGLVICSFFLAVLRYTANIYRSHHDEMLKAYRDGDEIRRYYVAFMGSEGNDDARSKVVANLMSICGESNLSKSPDDDSSEKALSVLKEAISIAGKKL